MYAAISLVNLRHPEFIQFNKTLLSIVSAKNPEVLKVTTQVDQLKNLYTNMTDLYNPERGNAITQDLQNLDSQRDNCLMGIEQLIRAYTHHFEDEKTEAANLLMDSLTVHGNNASRLNYQAETNTINNLVKTWTNSPLCTNALNLLGASSWINKLQEINNQFETRYLDRIKDEASAPEFKMIDYRKKIIESYRDLIRHLDAHATLTGDAIYLELQNEINQLIAEYNKLIENRTKKKEETLTEE